MAANNPGDHRHDPAHSSSRCRKPSAMAVTTQCGRCQKPVVGAAIREMPGWCSVECKSCGYSAISHAS